MRQPRVDATQLQQGDKAAWTALLRHRLLWEDVRVTAVSKQRCYRHSGFGYNPHLTRYVLTIAGQSDPITFIGKWTDWVENRFYEELAATVPFLAPNCLLTHRVEEKGWLVLEDVPNHFSPPTWLVADVEAIIRDLTDLHALYWQKTKRWRWLPHFIDREKEAYTWERLRAEKAIYFEEGPAAVISDHAVSKSGRLAPILLEAANGLTVLRSLGGWPGVLGESQLTAVAELLDDPVPMLSPLDNLPVTLLHGDPANYHWHVTLFDERRLFDWQRVMAGPGILDLVYFVEQMDLIYMVDNPFHLVMRPYPPITEETVIDSYMLTMSERLGSAFPARLCRQAIPAARCLHLLTHWLPHFAGWFDDLPDKYVWQRVNRLPDQELVDTPFASIVYLRPYLRAVFQRFLQAYRML